MKYQRNPWINQESQREYFIAGCPATTAGGGDFWHIATAHIICSKGDALGKADLICLIGADYRGQTRYIRIHRLKILYDYFQSIGLRCVLAKFDIGTGEGESHITYERRLMGEMAKLSRGQYEEMIASQWSHGTGAALDWDAIWSLTGLTQPSPAQTGPTDVVMIQFLQMTTIISNFFHPDLPAESRAERFSIVRHHLAGTYTEEEEGILGSKELAHQKVVELRSLILATREKYGPEFSRSRVVLVMFRKGTVNFRQDVNNDIWEQLINVCLRHGLIPIRVAVGLPPDEVEETDLDLFNVRVTKDFVDKRYIAYFWSLVTEMEDVFGVAGPRTGSLDAAAFQGLNSFSWDGPMMEIICNPEYSDVRPSYSEQYISEQLFQQVLLWGMHGIHSIGTLDPRSLDLAADSFRRLKEEPLSQWLSGQRVSPQIPSPTPEILRLIDEACEAWLSVEGINLRPVAVLNILDSMKSQLFHDNSDV
ncbi:hypothetical protein F4774DRAFT_424215 [Daldinia eschscholtzii]|nr:hypothetical protein F4774DRAFT_424215 [Daldinia eschscholtzii]